MGNVFDSDIGAVQNVRDSYYKWRTGIYKQGVQLVEELFQYFMLSRCEPLPLDYKQGDNNVIQKFMAHWSDVQTSSTMQLVWKRLVKGCKECSSVP